MITTIDPFRVPTGPAAGPHDSDASRSALRVAILGGGPVGLDAALAAREAGFRVRAWEAASRPAGHIRQWGHVQLFTPWRMNLSTRMRRALEGLASPHAREMSDPPWRAHPDRSPTGHEYVDRVLEPLWDSERLDGVLRTGVTVRAVSRQGVLKHEEIGAPERGRRPFRILLEDTEGREWTEFADVVLDCTGKFGNPNALGDGGIRAPGERAVESRIRRRIPDLGSESGDWAGAEGWAGATVLLVGGGHSAQTAVRALERLARDRQGTQVEWVLRDRSGSVEPIADDPLPQRRELTERAAELASGNAEAVRTHRGMVVDALEPVGSRVRVRLRGPDGARRELDVDRILGLTGGVGDHELYRQLQVHECYATSGPMKLAASLLASATDGPADCLAQPAPGIDTLTNPEPDFYIVGDKSYGRNNTFLLETGWAQVDEIFGALAATLP